MADWSLLNHEWLPAMPPSPYHTYADCDPFYQKKQELPPPAQPQLYLSPPSSSLSQLLDLQQHQTSVMPHPMPMLPKPREENPREIRNRAEKQRRDKLNSSIAELASMVPPVLAASRKIDKTGVLRLTAHYLRSHQYVFGDSIGRSSEFTAASARALLSLLNGFLLTTTYKGLIVVVSQNVAEYLGYTELELLGQNILNFTHEDDREKLKQQLMPRSQKLGTSGELLMPDDAEGRLRVEMELANEKRKFTVRLKKLGQRSGPSKYVTCHVEGSLRKSDRACGRYNRCCPMLRRARARGDNPCSSGNDVVFIGVVRPTAETFMNESAMETYKMEYRTRHSVDGEIIQCEQRIALVTGYMTHEVRGVNAMNFIHRDEVRCVILALRAMYVNNHLFGESCYRLMTKTGQLTYMRTRGRLEVDAQTRAVTSFVCTNTVVEEPEGKHLIQIMKEKYKTPDEPPIEDIKHNPDNQAVPVEDPKQLKKDIMRLVTDLPAPEAAAALAGRFAIIPPMRERIISAIEKIYTVFNYLPNKCEQQLNNGFVLHKDIAPTVCALVSNSQGIYDLSHSPERDAAYSPDGTYTLVPSDFDYLPPARDAMAPYTEEMRFQMYPPQELAMSGPSVAGVKRSNYDIDAQETSTKKKVIGVPEECDASAGRDSPSLESFFDEAILNTQIESALNSLEHTIDPSFPDLLIANEVQEILGQIESDENV